MADTFNNNQTFNQNNQQNAQNTASDANKSEQSSSSQATAQSSSNNDQSNKTDYSKVALSDRTSTHDVDNHTRDVNITEKDGTKVYAQLQAPKLKALQDIQDSRYGGLPDDNGNQVFRTTTSNYYEHLFPLFHNTTVNDKPDIFGWDFGDVHYEAFNWLISQADTFLGDVFNTNN